jgi:hypothetical protein
MKRRKPVVANPPRLVETAHPCAELLGRANREYATLPEETEAFCRRHPVPASSSRRRGSVRLALFAALVLVAMVVGIRLLPAPHEVARSSDGNPSAPLTARATQGQGSAQEPRALPIPLTAGPRTLPDGSVVQLSSDGSAVLVDASPSTTVVLSRGELTLDVIPLGAGRSFEVRAGAYRFVVLGTRFRVASTPEHVALEVNEGSVAVFTGTEVLATVKSGQRWNSNPREPHATRHETISPGASGAQLSAAPSTSTPPPAARQRNCKELIRVGRPREAEQCFLAWTSSDQLSAEMGLYEVARLRRDVLGDAAGALHALTQYRERFPQGTLRSEVDMSYVALLTRLGRHREALSESERLLRSTAGRERAFELRLLRGQILRVHLGNQAGAEREYAQAERVAGATPEATYLRGLCLEELGNASGAASAYHRYLEQAPAGRRADEVRRRLESLEQ